MKSLVVGLLVGLTAGYAWGYVEAAADKPHIARRVMVKFGAATIERTTRRTEEAIDSVGR